MSSLHTRYKMCLFHHMRCSCMRAMYCRSYPGDYAEQCVVVSVRGLLLLYLHEDSDDDN